MGQKGELCHLAAAEGLPSHHSGAPYQGVYSTLIKSCVEEFILQDCNTTIQFKQTKHGSSRNKSCLL